MPQSCAQCPVASGQFKTSSDKSQSVSLWPLATGHWPLCLYSAGSFVADDPDDLFHRFVEVLVDHHVVERAAPLGHVNLALRGAKPLVNILGTVPAAIRQPLQ